MDEVGSALSLIDLLLQIIVYSAVLTDLHQTQHWAEGPVFGDGSMLMEANPLIANGPDRLSEVIQLNLSTAHQLPRVLHPPWSTLSLGLMSLIQVSNAIGNNENARYVNVPEYWMLGYVMAF